VPELFHITTRDAWAAAVAGGDHRPASLDDEGFVHLSYRDQVVTTADRFYRGETDLVLLSIDPAVLVATLVVEDSYGHGKFPHLYGPLNLDAVTAVVDFPPDATGGFSLPMS
jgi:uncharacterized protein (DUF952 family)